MTLWVFDISATGPQDVGGEATEGRVADAGGASVGPMPRALAAVEKLRAEAIGRGDPVLEMNGIDRNTRTTILRFFRHPVRDVVLVSDDTINIHIVQTKTDWKIIDIRTLSLDDGKVVASAQAE